MCGRWSCNPMLISRFLRCSEWDPVPELKGKSQEHNLMMIKWSKYGKKSKMHGFADWLTGFRTWKSPDTSYFPWDSHVFPRFSIGFSMFSMGFPRFSIGFSKFSMGFYMALGWSVEDALRLMMFLANPTTWTDIQRSLA